MVVGSWQQAREGILYDASRDMPAAEEDMHSVSVRCMRNHPTSNVREQNTCASGLRFEGLKTPVHVKAHVYVRDVRACCSYYS